MADDENPDRSGEDEFQELLRNMLGGAGGAGIDPAQLEGLSRMGVDPAMLQQIMGQMQAAFTQSATAGGAPDGIDWTGAKTQALHLANRDPAAFPNPDQLDITRHDVRPISFGGGIHHCLGAQLARIEAQEAFAGLTERLPTLTLPTKETPAWRRSFTLRGLTTLPAVWQ